MDCSPIYAEGFSQSPSNAAKIAADPAKEARKSAVYLCALDGAVTDALSVSHLLEIAIDLLGETDLGTGESRNHELDRVNSLVVVCQKIADGIAKNAMPRLDVQEVH